MRTAMEFINWTGCGGLFFWLMIEALGSEDMPRRYGLLTISVVYLIAFLIPIFDDK